METSLTALRSRPRTIFACALMVLAAFTAEGVRWTRSAPPPPAMTTASVPGRAVLTEVSKSLIPMPPNTPSAHASALTSVRDGMLAFWWAGSRESGPDVKVYAARWKNNHWSKPWEVAGREGLSAALGFGVRRIGNPVAWTAPDGRVHLYVVSTGLGGWAASRIVHMISTDEGSTFKTHRLLPLSPLFNTSVLVRTAPVALPDGGWWLPLYFEIGIKYPMLMAFDHNGEPTRVGRIGARMSTLQPAIVRVSATEVRAWMRDAGGEQRVQQAVSRDDGASWEDLPSLDMSSHNTSLAVIRLTSGEMLMLHNHVGADDSSRSTLRLSISKDGQVWRTIGDVADGKTGDEFSYPTMHQVGQELHITYTYQRQAIAHHTYRIAAGENI
jgi:predicted neuraminidase